MQDLCSLFFPCILVLSISDRKAGETVRKAFVYVFRRSIPIFIGFFPVGLAYGVLMQSAGYNALWSGACSLIVLTGALQFLMVDFFTSAVPLVTVAVMALLLSSRHIFYGLSFIEKFRSYGPWKWFLIWSLNDETYSLDCSFDPASGVDEKWACIFSGALVPFYWIVCAMLGGLVGRLIRFDTTGIDFALTALFLVILIDQLRAGRTRVPAIAAGISSLACILIFGPANFILPSLVITVTALTLLRPKLEPFTEETEAA